MEKIKEKLKTEDGALKLIAEHLIKHCEAEPIFKEKIMDENKSLEECFRYIKSEARKESKGNTAVVEKEKVFGWAIHYFDEKDLKFDLQTARVSTSNEKPKVQIKKPEKKEKKEKIVKEQLSLF